MRRVPLYTRGMRRAATAIPFAAGLLLSVVVPRLLVYPVVNLGPDEVAYALIGREILHGSWPYTTAFDHKPVGLYLPYAAVESVMGANLTALRTVGLLIITAGYVVTWLLARRLGNTVAVSTLLACVYGLMTLGNDGLATLSEHFLVVHVLLLLLLLVLRRSVWTGLAFGGVIALSINTNYLIGPLLAVIGLFYLWRERRHLGRCAAAAGGFVVVTVALLLPIWLWSDLTGYFTLQREFLTGYHPAPRPFMDRLVAVQRFFSPTLPVLALSAAIAAAAPRTRTRAVAKAAVLVAICAYTSVANAYYFPHYSLLLIAGVVFLLAVQLRELPPVADTVRSLRRRRLSMRRPGPAALAAALAVAVAGWSVVVPKAQTLKSGAQSILRQHDLYPDRTDSRIEAAAAARAIVSPGDVVYTRDVHYYLLTQAALPTRFLFPSHHLKVGYTAARGTTPEKEMQGIVARRPVVVMLDGLNRVPAARDGILTTYLKTQCRPYRTVAGTRIYDCR